MTASRPLLRDAGLVLLALLVTGATAYVLLRQPGPRRIAPPPPPQAAATPTVGATPEPVVTALFMGTGSSVEAADEIGAALSWRMRSVTVPGGFVAGEGRATYAAQVPAAVRSAAEDVVLLAASPADGDPQDGAAFGGAVQSVVFAVRQAVPDARIVLLAPVSPDADAFPRQREVLRAVAARYGAFFVDPVGAGYLVGRPELLGADDDPTPAGDAELARRLAADLARVLPPKQVLSGD